jgi:hypothetical protein
MVMTPRNSWSCISDYKADQVMRMHVMFTEYSKPSMRLTAEDYKEIVGLRYSLNQMVMFRESNALKELDGIFSYLDTFHPKLKERGYHLDFTYAPIATSGT